MEEKKGIYRDHASQRQTKVNILHICKEIDNSVNRKQFQVFAENGAIYQFYNYHKQTTHYQSIQRNISKSTNGKQIIVKAEFFIFDIIFCKRPPMNITVYKKYRCIFGLILPSYKHKVQSLKKDV